MSLGTLWAALRTAPAVLEGFGAAGDAVAAGRSPLAAVDAFVARSGLGADVAGELRALIGRGIGGLALVAGTASRLVAHEPEARVLLDAVLGRTVNLGLWAAAQEYRLKGWLAEARGPPREGPCE